MSFYLRNMISSLYEAVSAPVAATRDALTERLQSVRETASLLYNNVKERLGYGQALKKIVEDAASEEEQAEEVDLTPQEHEHAMKKAFQSFRMPE